MCLVWPQFLSLVSSLSLRAAYSLPRLGRLIEPYAAALLNTRQRCVGRETRTQRQKTPLNNPKPKQAPPLRCAALRVRATPHLGRSPLLLALARANTRTPAACNCRGGDAGSGLPLIRDLSDRLEAQTRYEKKPSNNKSVEYPVLRAE